MKRWDALALGGLLLLTGLVYLPLMSAAFSWDDVALVADNRLTDDLKNLPEILKADLWATTRVPAPDSGYYRPLMLLSLTLDRAVLGLGPTGHHAHSLLWHLLAVAALYGLLRRLVPDSHRYAALAGAALFALHPVQSETLALVAARNDSMAAALTLAALLTLTRDRAGPGALLGGGALALLGLLSKESAVLAPLFLLAVDLAQRGDPRGWIRERWPRYAALAGSVVIYLGLRAWAGVNRAVVPDADNFGLVAGRAGQILSVYAGLIVWPWPLSPARHVHYLPALGTALFGLAVFTALTAWLLAAARDRRLALAGLAWALLAFLPTLAATLDKGLLGERYLYFPLAGLGLALASALPAARWLLPTGGAVAAACAGALWLRLPDWEDSLHLWQAAHRDMPSAFTHAGLAHYLRVTGDLEGARTHYIGAIAGDPPYTDACSAVVLIHLMLERPEEAVRFGSWARADRGCKDTPDFLEQLAIALAGTGRWDEAVAEVAKMPGGPAGLGLVVLAASRARLGDWASVERVAGRWKGDRFPERVAKLLRLSGEAEAAAAVLQRYR